MNSFSFLFLAFLTIGLVVQYLLIYRHIHYVAKHKETVPEQFTDKISLEAHQKAADYTQAKSRTASIELIISTVILLAWTLGGGLNIFDNIWRKLSLSPLWTGVGLMLTVMLLSSLLDLPMSVYRTFVQEENFGFNKTTPKTFITDLFKSLTLSLVIGVPMLALVLWLMMNAGDLWWLYVWMTWLGFSLFMMWFYPAFIAPIFNKFRPLENQDLKTRIESLLDRNGFTSQGVFVMDGSTRSTYNGLGVEMSSTYMALILFMFVIPVFTFFMQPMFAYYSRLHEFEADDFAANQAQSENLIQALVKLYKENANTLTPDPLYSAFHDSHPPAPIRIAHLSEKQV